MKRLIFFMLVSTGITFSGCIYFISEIGDRSPERVVRMDTAASLFEEAFPMGNGRIGATLYGGATVERIMLNEATLWSGEPVDPTMNPDAHTHLPAVREALFKFAKDNGVSMVAGSGYNAKMWRAERLRFPGKKKRGSTEKSASAF